MSELVDSVQLVKRKPNALNGSAPSRNSGHSKKYILSNEKNQSFAAVRPAALR
jgi:hypothetical protein